MDTCFAPAERASDDLLREEIERVAGNPIMQELLHNISGLIAVLDQHRQVIAINDSFLETFGISDSASVLGLRLGEVLGCIHCHEEPNGCGTTKYCSTCGAAIAMVSTLVDDKPVEKICSLVMQKGEATAEMAILVRASPLRIEEKKHILLFLQDITLDHMRMAMERTFFHDMDNMFTGLLGASQFLLRQDDSELVRIIHRSARMLYREIEIQKCLFKNNFCDYRICRDDTTAQELLTEINGVFSRHQAAAGKDLLITDSAPGETVKTDKALTLRVMSNMVLNALEATEAQGSVKMWFEQRRDGLLFRVWNDKAIPEDVQLRIFQRSFSTKEGNGRGVGTYSMQLLGEKLLGGKVSFTSTKQDGTIFSFLIPAA